MKLTWLFLCITTFRSHVGLKSNHTVFVDYELGVSSKLSKFWTNTGLSPPGPGILSRQFLTSADEKMNLLLIGSLPFDAVTHVRVHWLLDLISFNSSHKDSPLNFTLLDNVLNTLHEARLLPGFEIMGYPESVSKNFFKYFSWKKFIQEVLERYIGIHGYDNVKNWRFETWNEPDLKMYNILNFTASDYLSYVNETFDTMNQFDLTIGGPAGLFKAPQKHQLCWGFLNFFVENPMYNLNFISYHKKGNSDVRSIILKTVTFLQEVSSNFSHLKNIPFANSEADFLTGWWRDLPWRSDVRYAAVVAESVLAHFKFFKKTNLKLAFISHDNGFMNYYPYFFSQRTLLARFQMNNTIPSYSQFFRKPAINVLILLALLEELTIKLKQPYDSRLKIIATRSSKLDSTDAKISILAVYNEAMEIGPIKNFQFFVNLPPMKKAKYSVYVMDNALPNPSSEWEKSGSPPFPDKFLRHKMRLSEDLYRFTLSKVPKNMPLVVSLQLSMPSVVLIHICAKAFEAPGKVTSLRISRITFNEVLLSWSDQKVVSKCLNTYEVEFHAGLCSGSSNFTRINPLDSLFLSYHFAPLNSEHYSEIENGCYRVRAVDYWGRPGNYSESVMLQNS